MKKLYLLLFTVLLSVPAVAADKKTAEPAQFNVRMTTNVGVIELHLDGKRAPATVGNFLHYVQTGYYNGTIFHRVIPGFMIQGGGFEPGMKPKPAGTPIPNEADNGLKNVAGSIAMARTAEPNSASSQFFINAKDNDFLNFTSKTPQGWGYAVFGKVTKGMDVVRKIEKMQTHTVDMFENVPKRDVIIKKIEVLK